MSVAIRFENVGKQYRLGEVGTGTLSHDLHRAWARLRGKPDPFAKVGQINDRTKSATSEPQAASKTGIFTRSSRPATSNSDPSSEYVWALRDINFEVKQGEILGIIGPNGAGKSTLLKLLSRVTAPTTGSIKAKGRIASLLEVGTGFHPELTGRENIYLNGAIMGMTRQEISKRLDEIVEFSGCAKYIDTPVKRYSSGMMVRLGFAVAAHLQSEILIIDEVLAVGDWDFQKRCIAKMREVSESGRTMLFVSHNMASVRSLCARSIVIDQGHIDRIGDTDEMIEHHMASRAELTLAEERRYDADSDKPFQVSRTYLAGTDGKPRKKFSCGEEILVVLDCVSRRPVPGLYGYLDISRNDGQSILVTDSFDNGDNPLNSLPAGNHTLQIPIPARILGHGSYQVVANFTSRSEDSFEVDSPGVIATCELRDEDTRRGNTRGGVLSVAPSWSVIENSDEIKFVPGTHS